jgi:beta-lactamase regulating signal transducer with metallopeptidase domain
MITLLCWLGQNTFTIVVMILFVAAACRLFRNRPAVQHVLWVIILLKFVTPPVVSWPWSVQQVGQALRSLVAHDTGSVLSPHGEHPAVAVNAVGDASETGNIRPPVRPIPDNEAPQGTSWNAVAAESEETARLALGLLTGIWLVGGAICAARQLRRIAGHALLVRRGTTAPEHLAVEVEAVARQIGLRPPRALVARGIMSPFVWFLIRLRLVWPEVMSSGDEIVRSRGVIAHELAHIRRGDHWVAWLELVAGLVWWWNPLFWFVRSRVRASAEMACDAIALCTCAGDRSEYARLLVELSAGPNARALAPVLGVKLGAPNSFERRLSMILSDRVSGNVSLWGFLMAGVLPLVALPAWTMAQQEFPQDKVMSDVLDDGAPSGDRLLGAPRVITKFAAVRTATPVETVSQNETLAARLEKLEAEIHRLSQLIEQTQKRGPQPPPVPFQPPRDATARVYSAFSPFDATEPLVIMGRGRTYILAGAEKGAHLSALNNRDGRQIWRSQIPAPLPIRGAGVAWTLEEPSHKKQVILTWSRPNESVRFVFDTNTGEVLPSGDVPNPKYRDPASSGNPQEIESQSSRLDRLEKEVEKLRKLLQDPAQSRSSSTDPDSAHLEAIAKLQAARSRLAQLTDQKGAVSKAELEEARIELHEADKLAQLLSAHIRAEIAVAEEARKAAQARYERAKALQAHKAISQAEVDAEKAALAEAEARVKQLEGAPTIDKQRGH